MTNNRSEFVAKAKQLRLAEQAAQKKADDLADLQIAMRYELEEIDEQLRNIRADAFVADKLVAKRNEEEAESGLDKWKKKDVADGERMWANSLHEREASGEAG